MEKKIVRFEIQDMLPIGLTLVVAGIGLVYGLNVMGDVGSGMCTGVREHVGTTGTCYVCPNSSHIYYDSTYNFCANTSVKVASNNVTAAVGGDHSVNASVNAMDGVAKIPEKMPLIATVIVAAIIIGILVRYLMVRFT